MYQITSFNRGFTCWINRAESDNVHLHTTRCAYSLFLSPMVLMKFSIFWFMFSLFLHTHTHPCTSYWLFLQMPQISCIFRYLLFWDVMQHRLLVRHQCLGTTLCSIQFLFYCQPTVMENILYCFVGNPE